MSQRVLVTGGAGFLGVGLVERLLDEGRRVVVLDDYSRGTQKHLAHLSDRSNLVVVEGDVCNPNDLDTCFAAHDGVELIHHLAAVNGTKWFHEDATRVIDVNINGTLQVIGKAKSWGARLVLASSPEAFGDVEAMPLTSNNHSTFPSASQHQRFSYGASKYLDEIAVQHAVREGLDARIVRPFNGYGHRMVSDAYGQVVGMMFQAVQNQELIEVHGDGNQTRCFTHLDDLVDGFFLAGELDVGCNGASMGGLAFNLGSTEEISMLELAHAVNESVGSQAVDIVLSGGYPGDARRRIPDCTTASEVLGWHCRITLQEGLRRMWSNLQPSP